MKKKILVFLLTAAILGGGGAGGYAGYKNYRDKHTEAEVWSVASLDWGYWGSDMECSGVVTNDVVQQIYLNSEQQVEEVYVEEGQTVSVGDPLLKYDETSIQYEIQMKELDIETIQNNTAIAERALNRLQNMTPIEEKPEEPWIEEDTEEETTADVTPEDDREDWLFQQQEDSQQSGNPNEISDAYDAADLEMDETWENVIEPEATEEPVQPEEEPEEDTEVGIGYTKEELAREILTTKNKLRDLDVSLRMAQLELTKLKKQAEDATVYASINGVVKTLQDVDNLPGDGSAFLVVTGSDGLYVKGQIGELLLDQVTPGTPVSLTSWQSNAMCDATITEIAEYPSDDGYYGSGNPNSSYYEFTAYIEDAGALTNGEAVDITIQGAQDVSADAIYLQKAYVRKENGKYYVLKEDGDGRLKKQYVKTGKTVYGSAIEIRSGITADDYIAFPYGKTAKEGVRTKQADTTYYGMTERRSANV